MRMPNKIPRQPKTRGQVARPTLRQWLATAREFNRAGTEFLKVDVTTGLTLAKAAVSTRDAEKKQRNRKSARKAYDTIVRLRERITPTDADARQLDEGLRQLKAELMQLGEIF